MRRVSSLPKLFRLPKSSRAFIKACRCWLQTTSLYWKTSSSQQMLLSALPSGTRRLDEENRLCTVHLMEGHFYISESRHWQMRPTQYLLMPYSMLRCRVANRDSVYIQVPVPPMATITPSRWILALETHNESTPQ